MNENKCYELVKDDQIYGFFKTKTELEVSEKILSLCKWNISKINKGNNIFRVKNSYHVVIENNSLVHYLGNFNSLSEALRSKRELINSFKSSSLADLNKYRNIYKSSQKYYIKDDKGNVFGHYKSKDDALVVRKVLEKNDWNIEDELIYDEDGLTYIVDSKFNVSNIGENVASNIYKHGNVYEIFNDDFRSFGTYFIYDEALRQRDLLVSNDWNLAPKNIEYDDERIKSLSRWEKIVFDVIDNMEDDCFTFDDLNRYESNFRKYAPTSKIFSKVQGNLESLIDVGLVEKISVNKFRRLWS